MNNEENPNFISEELNKFPPEYSQLMYSIGINTNVLIGSQERYKKIQKIRTQLWTLPLTKDIAEKIAEPLNNIVTSYSIGNYLGTIAICGMLSEMSILLLYDIICYLHDNNHKKFNENPVKYEEFEKLGQAKREKEIKKFIANQKIIEISKSLRNIRRKYLHFFKIDYKDIQSDALKAFDYIIQMLKIITGLSLNSTTPGEISLHPDFRLYIRQFGSSENPNLINCYYCFE